MRRGSSPIPASQQVGTLHSSIWQGSYPFCEAGVGELRFLMPEPAEKRSLHYKTIHTNYTIGCISGNVHVCVYILYFNFTEIGPLSYLIIKSLKHSIPMATRDKDAHMSVRACACACICRILSKSNICIVCLVIYACVFLTCALIL